MRQVGDLNNLQAKYFDKGLRILAISAEPISKLESIMLNDKGAKYWIGSDTSRSMLKVYGGGGIPHAYLVDARGKIVGDAHSFSGAQIEKYLDQVYDPALGRELHKSLKGQVKLYNKGKYGKAWTGVARLTEHDDRGVATDAKFLREHCEAAAQWHQKMAEGDIKDKNYAQVMNDLAGMTKVFDGMEQATWAAAKQKELKADKAVGNELKAFKALAKARQKQLDAGGKAKKLKPVAKLYKRIVKKYPGTKAAELAEKALKTLPR